MWEVYCEPDVTFHRFTLDGEELVYIEEGCDWMSKIKPHPVIYFGFCLSKTKEHFHLSGDDLDVVKFKALIKLKEFGWNIEEWPN